MLNSTHGVSTSQRLNFPTIQPEAYQAIKDEVIRLYPNEDPCFPQAYPDSYRASEFFPLLQDLDRPSHHCATLRVGENFLGQPFLNYKIEEGVHTRESGSLKLNPDFKLDDLTFDHQRNRLAVQGLLRESQQWEVLEFPLEGGKDWRGRPQGRAIYQDSSPFAAIEYDNQGSLLVARDQQVFRLNQGQLEPILDCKAPVQDLETLADGGLVVRVKTEGPSRYDLLYQAPGQDHFQRLPLHSSLSELTSPDGQSSLACQRDWGQAPLFARNQQQELGVIHDASKVPFGTPFSAGYDKASLGWSPDSRFFKATSQKIPRAVIDLRDTLLWDASQHKRYILPGVSQLDFLPDGRLQLQVLGQEQPRQLSPEQLSQIEELPAYPSVVLSKGVRAYQRDGSFQQLVPVNQEIILGSNRQQNFLIMVQPDQREARLLELNRGVSAEIKDCRHIYWDDLNDELGVISGQPAQLELIAGSELSQSRWYRGALEAKVAGQASTPAALVHKQADGTVFNGLKINRKGSSQ